MTDPDNARRDPAEYNESSIGFDYASLDSLQDVVAELFQAGGAAAVARFIEQRDRSDNGHVALHQIQQLAAMFFDPRSVNPRHWGLARALQIDAVRMLTDEQIGDHCGVTKAAISKEARQWVKILNIPPPPGMKSERACESYRQVRLRSATQAKTSG